MPPKKSQSKDWGKKPQSTKYNLEPKHSKRQNNNISNSNTKIEVDKIVEINLVINTKRIFELEKSNPVQQASSVDHFQTVSLQNNFSQNSKDLIVNNTQITENNGKKRITVRKKSAISQNQVEIKEELKFKT